MRPASLTIRGRDGARAVVFSPACLLAPMDGYTDRTFRDLVLDLGGAGGASTEFVRISAAPVPRRVIVRELGHPRADVPVGVQLMAADPEFVAETVASADAAGASWIDLNFGCPVKRVVNKCAGSALLAHPERLAAIVAAAASATSLPVTAKVRAGIDDASPLGEVLDACAEAGAAAVTLHARLRTNSYADPARWEWIASAAARLHDRRPAVPLIGNGGVATASDVARMRAETGCDAVMIGRAALADPWIFRESSGGPPATREEALGFALRYFDVLLPAAGPGGALPRFKAFLALFRSAGIFDGREAARRELLREPAPARIRAWFVAEAAGAAA